MDTKPILQMRGVFGPLITILAIAAGYFGVQVSPEEQAQLVQHGHVVVDSLAAGLAAGAALVGAIIGIVGRLRAKSTPQPLNGVASLVKRVAPLIFLAVLAAPARAQVAPPDFDCAKTADSLLWTAEVLAPSGARTSSDPQAIELVRVDPNGTMGFTCFGITPDVATRFAFAVDKGDGSDALIRARAWETADCSGDPAAQASGLSANLCIARFVPEPPLLLGP